jgi:hypothetical protein
MAQMQEAISKREFDRAARLARENLRQIPNWVKETRREYGRFDIQSIPAIQQGGTILALNCDDDALAEMQRLVASMPDLEPWAAQVTQHAEDRRLFPAILDAIQTNPGCLQTDIKTFVALQDGHRIANLISYLEKAGKIIRIKEGRSYKLLIPGSPDAPVAAPRPIFTESHRSDRMPPPMHEIDISCLDYVPLPRSPLRWEQAQSGRETRPSGELAAAFEARDAADWRLVSIEKMPKVERPDPAFRQMHPTGSGLFLIDDLGKAEGLGPIEAAVLSYDRSGGLAAKAPLAHGIYRLNVHPLGRGLVAMSKECVVHAYDERLNLLFQTALIKSPEIVALKKRLAISDDQLKNHIRCVALSRDASRYLFTAVDEAWCIDSNGRGLWGAKLPLKEGWARVATPSGSFATGAEVQRALATMSLSLPVTPEDVKHRYRQLAKEWHPDLNRDDPVAEEKMKTLTAAAEVLSGVDASSLSRYTGTTFVRKIEQTKFEVGGVTFTMSFGQQGGEAQAADWIYAVGFAADSNSVYLACYSGRVVQVDQNGMGTRAYDIGSVPRRIADTGDYLYLLTDTRLYVLRNNALHALVDVFDAGDLVVAETGFGLLEKNRLRWFSEDGAYLGSVISKDPIRRVYFTAGGMVIETRQQRAVVRGVPAWWA